MVARGLSLVLVFALALFPSAVRAESHSLTSQWIVSDGGGIEAGGTVAITGLPDAIIFGRTYRLQFNFVVEWFNWGSHILPQSITWFARATCLEYTTSPLGPVCVRNAQNVTLDLSAVPGRYSRGESFQVTAYLNLFEQPNTNGTLASLALQMRALVECRDPALCTPAGTSNPAWKFSLILPETTFALLVLEQPFGPDETRTATVAWVVSDGGGVEVGGHVTVEQLPASLTYTRTYSVTFKFLVEWFDWGSHLRPQSISFFAKAGCLERFFGICTRNSENITLANSSAEGSFTRGETFTTAVSFQLSSPPSLNGEEASLGLSITALVECQDSTQCFPVGGVNPTGPLSLLFPETSVSFILFSTIEVSVDVRPGNEANRVNTKSQGSVPVAILTTPEFDASAVDPSSVRFGRTGAEAAPVRYALRDTDGDGFSDLILSFHIRSTGLQAGDGQAVLTGMTFAGLKIKGSDSIRAF